MYSMFDMMDAFRSDLDLLFTISHRFNFSHTYSLKLISVSGTTVNQRAGNYIKHDKTAKTISPRRTTYFSFYEVKGEANSLNHCEV